MYKRSYNRGRRGMTFKFKPAKPRKFKSAVPRPMINSDNSEAKLILTRIVIAAAVLVVAAGAVLGGIYLFGSVDNRKSVSNVSDSENNNAQLLRVVNKSNPLDKDYVPELVQKDGYRICPLAEKSLDNLLAAAKKENISLYVKYAFVSYNEQAKIYNAEYRKQLSKGLTEVKAQAKTTVTIPQAGRSEFQTGLMVSFRSREKGKFKNSNASDWLFKNAKKYGFVLRYPEDKEDITSMNVNYKSYRYVGESNAKVMQSLNMCLNEYSYYVNSRQIITAK